MQKLIILLVILLTIVPPCLAAPFYLKSSKSGKRYGPFESRIGAKIKIGGNVLTITRPTSGKRTSRSGKRAGTTRGRFCLTLSATGKIYGPFVFKRGARVILDKSAFIITGSAGRAKRTRTKASIATPRRARKGGIRAKYAILNTWKPNNDIDGFGADVLVQKGHKGKTLINLVRALSRGHDPVNIRLFTSKAACQQERGGVSIGPEYRNGYILMYMKNTSGRGPHSGINEIQWMQHIGKFSDKLGTITRFR